MSKFIMIVTPSGSQPLFEEELQRIIEGALTATPDGHCLAVEPLTEHLDAQNYVLCFEAPSLRVARELAHRIDCQEDNLVGLWQLAPNGTLSVISVPTDAGDMVDEASRESFPASDPPAWSAATGTGA